MFIPTTILYYFSLEWLLSKMLQHKVFADNVGKLKPSYVAGRI